MPERQVIMDAGFHGLLSRPAEPNSVTRESTTAGPRREHARPVRSGLQIFEQQQPSPVEQVDALALVAP